MIDIKREDDITTKIIKEISNGMGIKNQKELAKYVFGDLNYATYISDIFKGSRRSLENMSLIANKLNTSLDYIYGLSDLNNKDLHIKISDIVGLSDDAIDNLIDLKDNKINKTINYLLSSPFGLSVVSNIDQLLNFNSSEDGSYICSKVEEEKDRFFCDLTESDLEFLIFNRIKESILDLKDLTLENFEINQKESEIVSAEIKELEDKINELEKFDDKAIKEEYIEGLKKELKSEKDPKEIKYLKDEIKSLKDLDGYLIDRSDEIRSEIVHLNSRIKVKNNRLTILKGKIEKYKNR